jgi:Fe/S biogenesis protein NfuA
MLQFTDTARDWIARIIDSQEEKGWAVRLTITGRGAGGFQYDMSLVKPEEAAADDVRVDAGPFQVLVAAASAADLQGSTIDLVENFGQSSLKIDNPNPVWSDPLALAVQRVLDEEINPGVAGHGGFVTLLDVKGDTAYVALGGGCQGCGMADVTLKQGIEVAIRRSVPEIAHVLDTTDHASGANPYYQPAKGGASPFGG